MFLYVGLEKQGNPNSANVIQMFREADKNGDGTVSWVEFLDMTKKRMKGVASKPSIAGSLGGNLSNDRRTEIMKMFNRMDPNGNGFVDRNHKDLTPALPNSMNIVSAPRVKNSSGLHIGKPRFV